MLNYILALLVGAISGAVLYRYFIQKELTRLQSIVSKTISQVKTEVKTDASKLDL